MHLHNRVGTLASYTVELIYNRYVQCYNICTYLSVHMYNICSACFQDILKYIILLFV